MIHVEVSGSFMFVTMDGETTVHYIPEDLMPLFTVGQIPPSDVACEQQSGLTINHSTNERLRNLSPMS